ncbi:hypothetical protein CRYPA_940 [uncultured Candidatus Thioglobus sp.]|nr:hypothetical protein CRYPA_940 [uncultured Candidatus Thioglobus sp.]
MFKPDIDEQEDFYKISNCADLRVMLDDEYGQPLLVKLILNDESFCKLVQRVEGLISKENTQWSRYVEKTKKA